MCFPAYLDEPWCRTWAQGHGACDVQHTVSPGFPFVAIGYGFCIVVIQPLMTELCTVEVYPCGEFARTNSFDAVFAG